MVFPRALCCFTGDARDHGHWAHAAPTARAIVTIMTGSAVSRSGLVHALLLSHYSVYKADTTYEQAGVCADFISTSVALDRKKIEHIFFGTKSQ